MRGGSVMIAAGNYMLTPDQMGGGLAVQPVTEGVQALLESYGITVEQAMVMDPQNEPFPVVVSRTVNGFPIQEIQAINYPFFVDVRPDAMAADSPLVSNLQAITLNWASPVVVDETKNAGREVTVLLSSSPSAWTQTDLNIQPSFELYPELGFAQGEETQSYPLAVAVQGVFESAFRDQPSPLEQVDAEGAAPQAIPGTIASSPETARLVVVGSAEFLDDLVFDLSSRLTGDRYLNSLKFVQNAVAWSTEDLDLLSIRARGTSARVLYPLGEGGQSFWEIGNYVLAMLSLLVLGFIWNVRSKNEEPIELIKPKDEERIFKENEASHEEVAA